jgi:hypothetical protein
MTRGIFRTRVVALHRGHRVNRSFGWGLRKKEYRGGNAPIRSV